MLALFGTEGESVYDMCAKHAGDLKGKLVKNG
jgi:hypothetical protein